MRHAVCEGCGQSAPQGETVAILGKTLCRGCAEQFLNVASQPLPQESIQRQIDPTICGFCSVDGGDRELPKVLGVPTCEACDHKLRHRPFPRWIKVSAVALLVLVIGAFVHNYRFIQAHWAFQQSFRSLRDGRIHEASEQMASAAALVPDEPEFLVLSKLFAGGDMLTQEKEAEAAVLLKQAQSQLPPTHPLRPMADAYLAAAQAGVAFNAKDYDAFLAIQKEFHGKHPGEPQALLGMASAHACKYAVTGKEQHKKEAMKFLDDAAKWPQSPESAKFRERIEHRLHTRTILERKEFEKQFPNGWKPEPKP
jgi:hypothetical protein